MPACQPSVQSEYSDHCGRSTEYQVSPCLNLHSDAVMFYLPHGTEAHYSAPLTLLARVLMFLFLPTNTDCYILFTLISSLRWATRKDNTNTSGRMEYFGAYILTTQ